MSLASFTASASSSKPMIDSTGPNTSSWAIRMSGLTSVKMVGSTNWPPGRLLSVAGPPPITTARALGLGDLDVVEDLAVLRRGGDRADVGVGLHRIALARGAAKLGDLLGEGLVDRVLHQEPRAGDAGLAGGGEDAGDRARRGGVEVGVVEHDVGRLAAELERDVLQALGGLGVDLRAGRVRAGEGDLGDVRDGRPAPRRLPGRSR